MKKIPLHINMGFVKKYAHAIKLLPWVLGIHAFVCIIIFMVIVAGVGELLFYQYVTLVRTSTLQGQVSPTEFQENTYRAILQQWQDREETFKNTSVKDFKNPF